MSEVVEILEAIRGYARAYSRLETLQKDTGLDWLPVGDQKTGVIGEFYAKLYLTSIHPSANIVFGNPNQRGWDLQVERGSMQYKVQVKTVSEHSATRRISPIYPGWDQLFLLYLDGELSPTGFWVITDTSIVPAGGRLAHRTMPQPGNPDTGSVEFADREDRLAELLEAINSIDSVVAGNQRH